MVYPSRISTAIPPTPSTRTKSDDSAAFATAARMRPVSIAIPSARAARWGESGADKAYRQTWGDRIAEGAGIGRKRSAVRPRLAPRLHRLERTHGKPLPLHRLAEKAGDVGLL